MAEAVKSSVPDSGIEETAVSKSEDERRQCARYLPLKRRHCRMQASKGSLYCGEHFDSERKDNSGDRKRIRCPLDPSHTVFQSRLEQHVKKCNAAKKNKPACFTAGINVGSEEAGCQPDEVTLSSVPSEVLDALISKLFSIESKYLEPIPTSILTHPILEAELNNPQNGSFAAKHLSQQASILGNMAATGMLKGGNAYVEFGAGRGKLSHWLQQAVGDNPAIKYILVDRANCRRKMDLYHRFDGQGPRFTRVLMDIKDLDLLKIPSLQSSHNMVGVTKHLCGAGTDLALRCAVEQLCPTPPPHTDQGAGPVVAMEDEEEEEQQLEEHRQDSHKPKPENPEPKPDNTDPKPHYTKPKLDNTECKPSTPAAERDSPTPSKRPRVDSPSPPPASAPMDCLKAATPRLKGLAFALCCHHCCSWDTYVAREFFQQQLGLSAREFELVKRMSSWAVCGQRKTGGGGGGGGEGKTTADTTNPPTTVLYSSPTSPTPLPQSSEEGDQPLQPPSSSAGHGNRAVSHGNYIPHPREHIGLLCKRLLDSGRVWYLRGRGLEARLVEYVNRSVSLENVLLLATPSPSSRTVAGTEHD